MKDHFTLAALALLSLLAIHSVSAQQPAALPEGAAAQKIIVQSVQGKVQYIRGDQTRRLITASELTQGDKAVAQAGAVCKLEFQHPATGATLGAVIVAGYTEMTIAEAYQQGESLRTKLEVPQGLVRAGVVRTAVPPSFVIVTPREVVAVRGTEIREIEVSNDQGDHVLMGRIGVARVHDSVPIFRSLQAGQGTLKRTEDTWRGDLLVRAIEYANLTHRVHLSGPQYRGFEVTYDRESFDLIQFPGDNLRCEGNPSCDRLINQSFPRGKGCPSCMNGP